jgi:hypothetical protein
MNKNDLLKNLVEKYKESRKIINDTAKKDIIDIDIVKTVKACFYEDFQEQYKKYCIARKREKNAKE